MKFPIPSPYIFWGYRGIIRSFKKVMKEKKTGLRINNPRVSVIIPAYNAEKYVEKAVRSIMNQT